MQTATTQVERKKTLLDYLKAIQGIVEGLGTLVKTVLVVIPAVVSLLGYLEQTNRADFVGPTEIEIANVFNRPEATAMSQLKEQGFIPTVLRTCSGSVPAGHVREVFQTANGRKVVLVGKEGVTQAGRGLQKSTAVTVQVGNGQPCS